MRPGNWLLYIMVVFQVLPQKQECSNHLGTCQKFSSSLLHFDLFLISCLKKAQEHVPTALSGKDKRLRYSLQCKVTH